jgi:hypothetical protein
MPVLRIDDEVWAWLKSHATPFEDTPNSVLRRLAGLDPGDALANRSAPRRARKRAPQESPVLSPSVHDYVVTKSRDHVLEKAKLESDKRYMFEVRKDSYEFVFHPGIKFEGLPYVTRKAEK